MSKVTCFVTLALLSLAAMTDADELRDAVSVGDLDRVGSLLQAGADANTRYENQLTPIDFAGDAPVVRVLVAHGARLDGRDSASVQTPIERAAQRWSYGGEQREAWKTVVAELRSAGAEFTVDAAIYMNDIAFVQERLAKDRSWVNELRGAQSVPLRVAARTGRVEICRLLLDAKADPDRFEDNGFPIMVDAVKHEAVVKLLIEFKANLRHRITWKALRSGWWPVGDEASALHFAVQAGNVESVKLLVAAGLDPSATDDEGRTPLHVAIALENMERRSAHNSAPFISIMKYLLANDASREMHDKLGRTPLELARALGSCKEVRNVLGAN